MEKIKAKGHAYYDNVYRQSISEESQRWILERDLAVLPYITGTSVLDLGCGLGTIANHLTNRSWAEYLGLDFSSVAIEHASAANTNPAATFQESDILTYTSMTQWDTVLLLEVLEHIDNPSFMCKRALSIAGQRLIVTVPRDMPGRAHVKPTWTRLDLERMLGNLSVCELFGGEESDRWWLAVKEKHVPGTNQSIPRLDKFDLRMISGKVKPK
jgi:SAM-dependent methyltransferase